MQTLQEKYSKKRVSDYKRDEGMMAEYYSVVLALLLPSFCCTLCNESYMGRSLIITLLALLVALLALLALLAALL